MINSGAKGANFTFKTLSEIHKEENEVNVLETSPETIRAEESIEDSVNSGETRKHNEVRCKFITLKRMFSC
ncbi:unnamed protein product [Trichobilharzia regenti]|nr:unnamed protein product [Trichobilharzia regenti]